ncbi:MAG TPA: peptidase [Hellea balneolensis]|uniref:Peptidase n=1 Tax=Hellea balneolensis TaxID=287478 RepID=A0A7V5NW15_9PROT|nr:peptidase [Hellea balneolensis]
MAVGHRLSIHAFTGILTACMALILTACAGGSSNSAPPPPPPAATGPVWQQGVFEPSDKYANKCETPRTGINPATNQPYPDVKGSELEEKFWQRSYSNETYLWYNEIQDRDPATGGDRLAYFDTLKTTATTASGNPKDKFHFTEDTAKVQQRISSGASAGYGIHYAIIARRPPRKILVAFVEPNSPAADQGVARGAEILEVDGVDAVNDSSQAGVDKLNAGLFPDAAGESHSFKILDPGSTTPRTITMTSAIVTEVPVNILKTLDVGGNKVGYLHLSTFFTSSTEQGLFDAFTTLANTGISDLIVDLRYNGGGFLDISSEMAFMIAGQAQTGGKTFETLQYNDKHTTTDINGNPITPTPFYNTARGFSVPRGTALPSVNLNRVFILTTSGTCSASEALINGLRGIDVEVVLIGTLTCGKPYGFIPPDNCGITYFTLQFKGVNDKGFGDYTDGFAAQNAADGVGELIPGCEVSDDFTHALGDPAETQLATAISYIQTGSCPTSARPFAQKLHAERSLHADDPASLFSNPRVRNAWLLRHSLLAGGPQRGEE